MPVSEIYVKLVVGFPRDPKVRGLIRFGEDAGLARDLYVQMLLYCKETMSDGWVPVEEVGVLVYPLSAERGNQLAKQLAFVGLIAEESKEGAEGWRVTAYLKRNRSKADIERLSQVRSEAGRQGGRPSGKAAGRKPGTGTGDQAGQQPGSRRAGTEAPSRPDVERLCEHLADRIEDNGSKRPSVGVKWRDAARLMLDRDGRTEEQVHAAIDWCQNNEFWRRNVLSMPKLRDKYERLRLEAEAEHKKRDRALTAAPSPHQPTHDEFNSLRVNWARPLDEQEAEIDPRGNGGPDRVHRGHLSAAEDPPGNGDPVVRGDRSPLVRRSA